MPASAPNRSSGHRISVMRGHELVPLVPNAGHRSRAEQPWKGVLLERHTLEAIEIPEHEHRDLCLHLQLEGSPEMEWWSERKNNVEHTSPGSMILLDAGTRDRIHWTDRSKRLIVSVQPWLLRQVTEELGGSGDPTLRNRWSLRDPALTNLLREMDTQAHTGWPLGQLYASLLGMGFTSTLLRRYADTALLPSTLKGQLPLPKLRRAMEFMTENLHRDVHLDEIASETGLSAFHFAREFRATTGQTPYQYLLDQRIARAKFLLRAKASTVQDIAYETGFSSAANFVRTFRQRVGVTPGTWQADQ